MPSRRRIGQVDEALEQGSPARTERDVRVALGRFSPGEANTLELVSRRLEHVRCRVDDAVDVLDRRPATRSRRDVTRSVACPTRVETSGTPVAIASRTARGPPSSRDVTRQTSIASYARATESMSGSSTCRYAIAEPLEPRLDISPSRPGQQDGELGNASVELLQRGQQHVRPLDQLRLEPVAPAHAVLLERADHECGLGHARARAARLRSTLRRPQRETHRRRSRSGCGAPSPARYPSRTRALPWLRFVTWTRSMSA